MCKALKAAFTDLFILIFQEPAGTTVVTWQYFFEAEQFGDALQFRSTVLANTNSLFTKPTLV